MKKTILSILAVAFAMGAFAQKNVTLTIKHMLGTSPFTFNQAATNNIADNFSITRVDYYLSGFTIIHDGGMQTIVPANTILFVRGGANHVASLGTFNVTNIEGIKFSVGVNANVNATMEPATAAYPLDFTTNMWWGWASGYRFVALEGKSGTSLNQSYQYHGLFDPNYFEQTVMVNGVNSSNDVIINLDADYTEALKDINVNAGGSFHGVNTNDLTVLKNFRDHVFSAGAGFPLAVSDIEKEINLSIFPNPTNGVVNIKLDNQSNFNITSASIYDVTGKLINDVALRNQGQVSFQFPTQGLYFIQLKSFGAPLTTKKIVVQ